jgi:hypothetical protein
MKRTQSGGSKRASTGGRDDEYAFAVLHVVAVGRLSERLSPACACTECYAICSDKIEIADSERFEKHGLDGEPALLAERGAGPTDSHFVDPAFRYASAVPRVSLCVVFRLVTDSCTPVTLACFSVARLAPPSPLPRRSQLLPVSRHWNLVMP